MLALCTAGVAQENAAKLALAREVITAMQADKMFDSMSAQMKQMAMQMSRAPANATPEQKEKMAALQGKIMDLSMGIAKDMVARMAPIYAKVYSEAELNAIKAFFTSPEGQSMIAKQPQIMASVMPLMQEMQRELMPKIKAMVDETKAEITAAKAPQAPATN